MQKSLSAIGVGLLGVGSIVVPSSAAATTPECGTSTSSMAISFASGICQAEFSAGTVGAPNTFTMPSVASGLAAILVGAGGGSYVDGATGYAGSGGEVNYLDLSSAPAVAALSVVVGHGGSTSNTWSNPSSKGGDTSVTLASAVTRVEGGAPGSSGFFCSLDGSFNTYLGEGQGAGGDPVIGGHPGYACISPGPGVTPSAGDLDSATNPVAEIFSNYSVELGKGGYMANLTAFPHPLVQGPGQGASVKWDLTVRETVLPNRRGSDGLVVFRWYPTERNSLAVTGQDPIHSATTSVVSLVMVALGLTLLSVSSRMRRRRI